MDEAKPLTSPVVRAAPASPPYADLTPDCVLDALESVGFRGDGRLLALNSYENRVYQVFLEDPIERITGGDPVSAAGSLPDRRAGERPAVPPLSCVVAKFYRPERWTDAQIAEEHAFVAELAAREIPVVAPISRAGRTLHEFAGFRLAVYPRQGGRVAELDRLDRLEWIGRFIGRIHAVGALASFEHRPALDIAGFGEQPRAYLLEEGWIPGDLEPAWRAIVDQALDAVRRAFDRAGDVRRLRLHGDCYAGNVLWSEGPAEGPHFVDFDDSRMGPAVQDLWMLLSGSREDMSRQLGRLLSGYKQFASFDRRELLLVEALRTLRLIHYSAWLARRWNDPAFPAAFPWFGTQRYWQDRILELREQVAAMDEPPLVPQ